MQSAHACPSSPGGARRDSAGDEGWRTPHTRSGAGTEAEAPRWTVGVRCVTAMEKIGTDETRSGISSYGWARLSWWVRRIEKRSLTSHMGSWDITCVAGKVGRGGRLVRLGQAWKRARLAPAGSWPCDGCRKDRGSSAEYSRERWCEACDALWTCAGHTRARSGGQAHLARGWARARLGIAVLAHAPEEMFQTHARSAQSTRRSFGHGVAPVQRWAAAGPRQSVARGCHASSTWAAGDASQPGTPRRGLRAGCDQHKRGWANRRKALVCPPSGAVPTSRQPLTFNWHALEIILGWPNPVSIKMRGLSSD